jgi:glutaconate CoA-transferase subunit B
LQSVHPGHSLAEVVEQTGFAFDLPGDVAQTPPPSAATLALIRGPVGRAIAETYPGFALRVLGVAA